MEMLCRDWARRYGAIDIVCGPIFSSKIEKRKTIGKNKVHVPEQFFKVVLCRSNNPKAIGFIYNNVGQKQRMEDHVHTVDEIERLTGYDFFPNLPDYIEQKVEANANLADW